MQIQTNECEQQRQRDRAGDNQAGTEIVEEKYEDYDDQQHASQQVALHHLRRQRNQVSAVVEGNNLDVLGQDCVVEFPGLGLDPLQHVLGLFTRSQQDDALHGVVLFFVAELAQARGDADDDTAHVLDQHRRAVVNRHHHIADVLCRSETPSTAHVVKLPTLRIEAAAGIGVVGGERVLHLLD